MGGCEEYEAFCTVPKSLEIKSIATSISKVMLLRLVDLNMYNPQPNFEVGADPNYE